MVNAKKRRASMKVTAWLSIISYFVLHSLIAMGENNVTSHENPLLAENNETGPPPVLPRRSTVNNTLDEAAQKLRSENELERVGACLLYTSPSPRD